MLGSFTALIIFSLSTAKINSLKDAIRKTSVQMEERSDAPSVKFCSQPGRNKDSFCGGSSSDRQYCTFENDAAVFDSGCKDALRTSDPDHEAGGITAIITQGVFCTFYPNKGEYHNS
ncbi:hypothetical protein E6O75_ATG05944 [Venturia nashicola]|uniref:Uncharacterized protein n=1 Tax=Venturia nashicola TaxID=86259 RepID=A0A4Z1PCH5_9PEZI|nr:hypothetical protein E6O75_ATG05944 [Venturia nashicola]